MPKDQTCGIWLPETNYKKMLGDLCFDTLLLVEPFAGEFREDPGLHVLRRAANCLTFQIPTLTLTFWRSFIELRPKNTIFRHDRGAPCSDLDETCPSMHSSIWEILKSKSQRPLAARRLGSGPGSSTKTPMERGRQGGCDVKGSSRGGGALTTMCLSN